MSRKFAPMVIAPLVCGRSPRLFAKERVEAGIFLAYLGISQTNTNNLAWAAASATTSTAR